MIKSVKAGAVLALLMAASLAAKAETAESSVYNFGCGHPRTPKGDVAPMGYSISISGGEITLHSYSSAPAPITSASFPMKYVGPAPRGHLYTAFGVTAEIGVGPSPMGQLNYTVSILEQLDGETATADCAQN
jgi:hypothetical protein